MDTKIMFFTPEGHKELLAELKDLQDNKLPAIIDRVAKAREFGDLSENAEYHAAREDHAWIQGRIEELQGIISQAKVITDSVKNGEVKLGSVVVVAINGDQHEFHIVGEWEADPMAKKISHESPLGKALVGKKVGDKVEVEAPAGKVTYTVKAIK